MKAIIKFHNDDFIDIRHDESPEIRLAMSLTQHNCKRKKGLFLSIQSACPK